MALKVLQVGSSLFDWGGIERYVVYLSDGLAARGHEVTVVCPLKSPIDERAAHRKEHLSLKGQFRFGKLPAFLRLFRKRYDVVHVHFSPDFVIPAMAARMRKQPLIIMTRHLVLKWSKTKVTRYTKLFDHIIAVSDAARQRLIESGISEAFVTVAKAGCPPIDIPAQRVMVDDIFRVGYFGRLVPEKGVQVLLDAARSVPATLRVNVYGDGPSSADLRAMAPPNVHFQGFTPDVASALASVDAVAVPSLWEEAFPFAVLEAMSAGKPVILSNVGGLPEMVEQGRTGLLVEKGNSKALAGAMMELAANTDRARRMGENARRIHAAEYTVAKMAERIEAVYLAQRR